MAAEHYQGAAELKSPVGPGQKFIDIVDAHVHFWNTERLSYPWLAECGDLNAPMLPERLEQEIASIDTEVPYRIKGFVQVQADCDPAQTFDEIAWVQGYAQSYPLMGMVAYAPLEDGAKAEDFLARLGENPFVKGVRRSTQNEPEDFILRPGYLEGLAELEQHGLSADICGRGFQLPNVIQALSTLRERGGKTRIVLDHAGKPSIPDHPFKQWQTDIAKLAEIPDVYCKLSGLLAECTDGQWSESRIRPYLETALETFGVDRVLFSGDWPIVKFVNAEYKDWVEVVYATISQAGEDAVRKVFCDNAIHIYGL